MQRSTILTTLVLAASALSLQGCLVTSAATFLHQKSKDIIMGKDINLVEKQYAAADYLVQQSGNRVSLKDSIYVKPLTNILAPKLTADIANIIPEQIAQRYMQLGYNIDMHEVAQNSDDSFITATINDKEISHILQGTYEAVKDGVQINLRIQDIKTKRVESTFSYLLPYNSQIRKLIEPKAQIYTLSQEQK